MRNEAGVGEAACFCLMDWVGVEVEVGLGFVGCWTQKNLCYGSFEAAFQKKKEEKSELSRNSR